MEIQLNATSDEEATAAAEAPSSASPSLSHAVPMSSLLSTDVSTPRADDAIAVAAAPSRSGLSSLMNSPLQDEDEDVDNDDDEEEGSVGNVENVENDLVLSASVESDAVQNDGQDVEMVEMEAPVSKMPALRRPELRVLLRARVDLLRALGDPRHGVRELIVTLAAHGALDVRRVLVDLVRGDVGLLGRAQRIDVAGHLARVNVLVAEDSGVDVGLHVHVAQRARGLAQVLAGVRAQHQQRQQQQRRERRPSSHGERNGKNEAATRNLRSEPGIIRTEPDAAPSAEDQVWLAFDGSAAGG
ncbi:hypothetical protein ON010_g1927 [Phytophthora cinnamomi]|nr:hypothetical protein ON010_g1927 [Phytophthora cinnamomi]